MKVLIRVTRRTEYASIVEMPEEKYDRMRAELDRREGMSARRQVEHQANQMIDVSDWQDDSLMSLDEFEPFVAEGEGEKP